MWIYRRISHTPWTDKVTNQHILQKINIKSTELVQIIRTRKAKFYGHVRRHDSLQRVILEGKVEGKRGRERKRTSWTDNIKTHLGLPIEELGRGNKMCLRNSWFRGIHDKPSRVGLYNSLVDDSGFKSSTNHITQRNFFRVVHSLHLTSPPPPPPFQPPHLLLFYFPVQLPYR